MLTIRPEQMTAFQTVAEASFVERIADYIAENFGDRFVILPTGMKTINELPPETLQRMIENGLKRARNYGMTWESSLTSFVVMMFLVAPNFDDHPLLKRPLLDAEIEPDKRIEQLWERTTDANWDAAKQDYDAQAWNL